ncbi:MULTISPECIES: hypothetical protein [Burkholderia]|uniref:hypothetical protein n=1 Tax=Burkholderia TaxID=32008 RepID=UPI001177B88A|nr:MULTISPECIES: hypothetical protein [Burkholderia]EKS9805714.1 hypothetical protein [Burkholderia cepacia]EKS9814703.1 hypothetical protein [Burkholderia cepacia]EKS9820109.1 hypothetical protein [Burkholderia cepacia]EKS9828077.1 hypothetical protein [Burkholderia cepacia]EKS9835977.1 hypothetical protein [Burkholderia cepacia]
MPTFAEYMSTAAFAVSFVSLCVSAHVAFRDRARLTVSGKFIPASNYGPNRIVVAMVNVGRRPVILRLIGGADAAGKWSAEYLSRETGGLRLGEHERYEHTFNKDDTIKFHPEDDDLFLKTLWVEDSLGVRHKVPKASQYIERLWSS